MLYKYETHMHTSEGSACSSSTAAEMAEKYKSEGYTGIFVTDHFFNGNCSVPRDLPWKERVERYCLGYENALKKGREIGLDVFFGIEYGNGQADFLTYGIDGNQIAAHPEILDMKLDEYIRFVHSLGGMVIQAHPFREAEYIQTFTLCPRYTDGIEIINASHRDPAYNERARIYAEWYGLPVTAGSDSHNADDKFFGGGIAVDHKITCPEDYIKAVKERKLTLLAGRFGNT
jgi:predicted metal-dependent phosphoesterase TrpH